MNTDVLEHSVHPLAGRVGRVGDAPFSVVESGRKQPFIVLTGLGIPDEAQRLERLVEGD